MVGLRPTYGRVSRYGCMAAGWTRDKPGPLCRYVEDAVLVLRHVMGADPDDLSTVDAPFEFLPRRPVRGLKVGVLRDEFEMPREDEVRTVQQAALGILEELGILLEDITLENLPYREVSGVISAVESATVWEPLWDSPKLDQLLRSNRGERWATGRMIPATDYLKAERIRVEIMKYAGSIFSEYPIIVAPSWMGPAWLWDLPEDGPVIAPTRGEPDDPDRPRPRISRFSNLVGIPSVSVPCGFTASGLPLGIQFLGAAFDEAGILQIAHAYEQATSWHDRHPRLS